MKMEFIFDKEKMQNENYTEEECFQLIRDHFEKYQRTSKTLKEVEPGVYEGEEVDWEAFASAFVFPYSEWFLKVIKEWYWYVDEGMGDGEEKGDCLKSYYKVERLNRRT